MISWILGASERLKWASRKKGICSYYDGNYRVFFGGFSLFQSLPTYFYWLPSGKLIEGLPQQYMNKNIFLSKEFFLEKMKQNAFLKTSEMNVWQNVRLFSWNKLHSRYVICGESFYLYNALFFFSFFFFFLIFSNMWRLNWTY